ncbi:hypothetical protein ACPPVT_21390 [Angustibacter sp. McL0619]|uniref:hypothetical protein n=1 Tax=Angustibacter sp. McL0619 TaxID=3415676 RepID=UPI003CEF422D
MGYEVLDTDDGQVRLPPETVPPSHVVDLSDLVEPRRPATTRPKPPGQRRATDRLPPWARRLLVGSLAWPLCAAGLVGLVAGGLWAHHHTTDQLAAERAGRLSAVAIVTMVDATRAQGVADYTVKVINAGPLPLELVASPPGARPGPNQPVVHELGGAHQVPAGGSLTATVRLAVDCDRVDEPIGSIRMPLRTLDGVLHQVPITDQSGLDTRDSLDSPCADPGDPQLEAHLTGTVTHPLLTLRNRSGADLAVSLDLEHSPFIEHSAHSSVLHMQPALPQILGPHQVLPITLQLTPSSCPRNLAEVADGDLAPYVVLRAGPPDTEPLIQEPIGLDLSTLWGAALARDCS